MLGYTVSFNGKIRKIIAKLFLLSGILNLFSSPLEPNKYGFHRKLCLDMATIKIVDACQINSHNHKNLEELKSPVVDFKHRCRWGSNIILLTSSDQLSVVFIPR